MSTPTNTVTELQKPNPSEIIELFEVHLDQRLHYADWEANKAYTAGDTVSSTSLVLDNSFPPQGMVFECTSGGTSGSSLPGGFASASEGGTITDNGVTWTAKRPIKRFHAGTNLKTTSTLHEASIHFNNKVYEPFPVQTEGFDMTSKGTLPRPRLTISNLSPSLSNTFTVANGGSALPSGTISAMMLEVNKITVGNDLIGSTLVRIRTLRKFLDSDNFNSTNATADSTQKFPDEIYMIARKVLENQEIVQFECASMFDMAGVRGPKRQILPDEFPGIGEFFQ
jgi:lambda family phage minor tail protein L